MSNREARVIRIARLPKGPVSAADFEIATVPLPEPGPGQMTVRNLWLSVDPYMRLPLTGRDGFHAPKKEGDFMEGGAVGVVIESRGGPFKEGDHVTGMIGGWRDLHVTTGLGLEKITDLSVPLQWYQGPLGLTGLTAYAGIHYVLRPKAGEVLFMSAAAGAVGSMGAQLAKRAGCTVVGTAGGAEKVRFLRDVLKLDRAIDYRACEDLTAALHAAAPGGYDMYFDNVGAHHLEAAIRVLKVGGRAAICGMIAQYETSAPAQGPANFFSCVEKSITLAGFNLGQFMARSPDMRAAMKPGLLEGTLIHRETIFDGLERAPDAFVSLMKGGNLGKMLVKLA